MFLILFEDEDLSYFKQYSHQHLRQKLCIKKYFYELLQSRQILLSEYTS